MGYEHTQRAPIRSPVRLWPCFLVSLIIVAFFPEPRLPRIAAFTLFVVSFSGVAWLPFDRATIREGDGAIKASFGPVPYTLTFPFGDITWVEPSRTRFMEWGGIVPNLLYGRLYKVWGRDCVAITVKGGKTVRIGTDDKDTLVELIRERAEVS